jgi:hypothetical protein
VFPLFATGVIDTGGKFAVGINNTRGIRGNLPLVSLILMANLPLELLIPVLHHDLQISLGKNSK